ncbi:cytochrome-c peroxidase [Rhodomicrobium vannielii ATCC 17100]|uniref:Cytochrome-c peroxidase n=1 Tax=Rhodomicrobium udaipurense TaxID=1202716 RepID=A0A8I1KKE2_9HYPH|nr:MULTISPECIES: cytochrome-c peroxidase [Rhodomicrobium]KAI94924.1 cytochrome C peroxidase [Rhodomicrobium udaipurense JA643]MBJ7533359.1 cytochrome-c peroxidase [Rhodomicrobium vannielii ATCC 17100]MBJ7543954.1 cytochrome-c peroxidase [Rhodomicrobium udaipurense]
MKRIFSLALGLGLMLPTMASADDLRADANAVFKPIPSVVPAVKDNAVTHEKVELGKMLFFDPRLSRSQIISCNSCHNLGTGGVDAGPTSIGHGWQKGPRRAPTVLNSVFNIAQFWDGRAEDLKAQAKGPVQASVEMNNTPANVVATLSAMPGYVDAFKKAFPREKEPITFDNFAKAIEAFEATLITPAARFDQFLEGSETAFDEAEKKGLRLFMDKGCAACHNGINVGGNGYYPFGVIQKPGAEILPLGDKGRFAVSKTASDEYVFRAAPLRNVALRAPYFHSGQVWSLEQAVAVMGDSQLGEKLTDEDTKLIVAFLKTLTGEQPRVEMPILPVRTKDVPKPE